MARVVIENLTKVFKGPRGATIRAVNQASLTIEDGEFLVLVGPSGCGKTTTLRLIAGLEEITEGTIAIDGRVINRIEPKDRDIAMVFQNYALYPHMTVFENLAFGLKLRKTARAEIDKRVREAAELLDLGGCLDRKPGELSGGQRQRVAVGRAIVRKPALFLFDEPLSNLDAPLRAQMRREISRLHKRLATPVLYVTHDQAEAMTLGDRMAVMKDGVIQHVDKPVNVYQRPANLFVAGFIGSPPMNFFHGMIVQRDGNAFFQEQGASVGTATPAPAFTIRVEPETATQLAGYRDKEIVLGIRPEHISTECDAAVSGTTVEALIETAEFLGAESHLHARTAAHSLIARISSFSSTEANRKTSLVFDMHHARFFDPETQMAVA